MKKTIIKAIALSLVAIMMCCVFASCSNAPSGTYGNDTVTVEFSGEKVELTYGENKKTTVEGMIVSRISFLLIIPHPD